MKVEQKRMYIDLLRRREEEEEEEEEERLTRTDPRPAIERQEMEARQQPLPPLRPELLRILAPKVLAAMHRIQHPDDHLALLDEDGALPVLAAAARQPGVLVGELGVDRHDGVEAESLVEDVAEVFEVLDLVEGGRLAVEGGDLGLELGPDVRAAGEDKEGGGHEGGGGVAARDERVDDLVAQLVLVAAVLGELVQEDVALVAVRAVFVVVVVVAVVQFEQGALLGVGFAEDFSRLDARLDAFGLAQDGFVADEILGFAVFDGVVDDGAHVVVEEFARVVVLAALIPPVERAKA